MVAKAEMESKMPFAVFSLMFKVIYLRFLERKIRLNKKKIVEDLKQLEKEFCHSKICPAKEYRDCQACRIHVLINEILQELNGG